MCGDSCGEVKFLIAFRGTSVMPALCLSPLNAFDVILNRGLIDRGKIYIQKKLKKKSDKSSLERLGNSGNIGNNRRAHQPFAFATWEIVCVYFLKHLNNNEASIVRDYVNKKERILLFPREKQPTNPERKLIKWILAISTFIFSRHRVDS